MSGVIFETEAELPTLIARPRMNPGGTPSMVVESQPKVIFRQWVLVEKGGVEAMDAAELLVRTAIALAQGMVQAGGFDPELLVRACIMRAPKPDRVFPDLTQQIVADKQRFRAWTRQNCKCGLSGQVTLGHFPAMEVRPGDRVHPRLARWIQGECSAKEHTHGARKLEAPEPKQEERVPDDD